MSSTEAPQVITTYDGTQVTIGDEVFSPYTFERHTILSLPDDSGWFWVSRPNGGRELLDGSRICTPRYAVRMGWL